LDEDAVEEGVLGARPGDGGCPLPDWAAAGNAGPEAAGGGSGTGMA
jgi:hypothetical protein